MIYKKTMIKKIEKETGEKFLWAETSNVLRFGNKYYYCDYISEGYQVWNPKTGYIVTGKQIGRAHV